MPLALLPVIIGANVGHIMQVFRDLPRSSVAIYSLSLPPSAEFLMDGNKKRGPFAQTEQWQIRCVHPAQSYIE